MKRLGIVLACGLACVLVGAAVFSWWVNPGVLQEIRNYPHGEQAQKVMALRLPSGRTIPVNYLREGDTVFAAADFPWWRELRGGGGRGSVLIRGETRSAHVRAVEDDPALRESVFARLRPTAPLWWGVLIVADLD